ncbi:MAG: M20 family metallopeptidase [Chloroflexi bacterium]|nr:M20 family metallopeptidase [Chloroflexota bacterium]
MSALVSRLADLVAINSVNASLPGGPGEQAMADYVAEAARGMGADVEQYEVEPGRPNLLARIDRGRPRTLMFECHLDTVGLAPMPDALNPRVEGGRLYGRGSADPKGSLAAMLSVLESAAADPAFPVNVWLAGSMDEEITMRGSRALAERRPAVDAVIVGEPTNLQPIVAHKGVLRWRVRTAGVAAHSATPERGRNAIFDMQTVIGALRAGIEPGLARSSHPRLGPATWSVGVIAGGEAVNVVPDACQIDCDRRLLPGEDPDAVLAEVDRAVNELRQVDAGLRVEREAPYVHVPPMETGADVPVVRATVQALTESGRDPTLAAVAYATDASMLASVGGLPAVVLGPGDIAQAHTNDEWIDLTELEAAVGVYRGICEAFADAA